MQLINFFYSTTSDIVKVTSLKIVHMHVIFVLIYMFKIFFPSADFICFHIICSYYINYYKM